MSEITKSQAENEADEGAAPGDGAHPFAELKALIEAVEQYPDEGFRNLALELVSSVISMHHGAFHRIVEILAARPDGAEIIAQLGDDELVRATLMAQGLLPADLETRVGEALETARAELRERGADVELVSLHGGVARLRLIGSSRSANTSSAAFKFAVEQALAEAAPDLVRVEYEDRIAPPRPPALVQITHKPAPPDQPAGNWVPVIRAQQTPENSMLAVTAGDINLLLCNVAGTIYAARNACPHRQLPLEKGLLEGATLTCPWHGYQYDLRTGGRCLNDPGARLELLPTRVENGVVKVAL